jgi:tRNA A-37 threonylcarbamoyl transferase component Bud32
MDSPTSVARGLVTLYSKDPVAACLVRSKREGSGTGRLLIVVPSSGTRVRREGRRRGGEEFTVTIISRKLFENDVKRGTLGEFVATLLLEPYEPIAGADFLKRMETDLKVRIIREEVGNVDLRFRDLLPELLIDPGFFFHARMQRRARLFSISPSSYSALAETTSGPSYGFDQALAELAGKGLLAVNEHVRVTTKLMGQLPKPYEKVFMPFKEIELAIRRLAAHGIASRFPDASAVKNLTEEFEPWSPADLRRLPDPRSFLHLQTEGGLISMADKESYDDLISSGLFGSVGQRSVRRIGGALNFVYLIEFTEGDHIRRVVVKTYQDWYGLKWVPVSIWTIGSQNFEVLGERRLVNEYKMNRFLRKQGLHAPDIYHFSLPRRTIVQEYIEGTAFDRIAKRYLDEGRQDLLAPIEDLGGELARVHGAGAILGDSKPDNALLDEEGRIWFVDLEQASRKGSPAWDLAEFLYYSGHYTIRWRAMEPVVEAFLRGYLRSGKESVVKEISRAEYKRIFGIMTAPHIIMGISKVCASYGGSSS